MAIICEKAIGMIRCEEAILRQRLEHPELCKVDTAKRNPVPSSPLFWRGSLSGLMELICALDYSLCIADSLGEKQSFAAIVSAFEWLFNVTIYKPYDQRARLADRKRRLSILLPRLKAAFEKNIIHCGTGTK